MRAWTTIAIYSPDFVPVALVMTNGRRFFVAEFFANRMIRKETLDEAMECLMDARFVN